MKHRLFLYYSVFLACVTLFSCKENGIGDLDGDISISENTRVAPYQESHVLPGVLYVKISRGESLRLRLNTDGEVEMSSLPSAIMTTLNTLGTQSLTPVFPIDPRFEKRMREAGLHEWYEVRIDESKDLGTAITMLEETSGIVHVEKGYMSELPDVQITPVYRTQRGVSETTTKLNDPDFELQWHYDNQGRYKNSKKGADINLLQAWEYTTGTPNVIVAVVDGGIDISHEDLVENLWINKGEIPGNNIDDDNNGYVDDVHGVNFIHISGDIYPDADSHGTHVAGTVAARNNNNLGGAGVAGGNGLPDSGVRLMSCQKFGKRGEAASGASAAKAFVYAANNGAVICQNSWGYKYPGPASLPAFEREAIDYFINYAGCDNEGRQLPDAPMKGGVVIFAAGNDGKNYVAYPAAYNRVIAVSAMAPDWKKAIYTNRGKWVDIMAPGGDQRYQQGQVYSTLAPSVTGAKYGYMQGTSMACPHVSGIAALIASKYGSPGFTNEDLKTRLLGALKPVNIDVENPGFERTLGLGYIDAAAAFAENKNIPPDKVSEISVDPGFVDMKLTWSSVEDKDDKMPVCYNLYMDEKELSKSNYTSAKTVIRVSGFGIKPNTLLNQIYQDLSDNTMYHFVVEAVDRWGLKSEPVFTAVKTKKNNPPVFSGIPDERIRVSGLEQVKFTVTAEDMDGHQVIIKVGGEEAGIVYVWRS